MPGVERALPGCPPRLADRVAIGVLTRTYPPALVDRVLAECGRVERRHRLLPARLVVYYVLALALFAGWPTRRSCAAWSRAAGSVVVAQPREPWRTWRVPAKSALVQARARLGAAPLRVLFEQAAAPLATDQTQGGWYRGLRVLALDGTCLDVADTPANAAAFGRPGTGRGQGVGAFPQVRLVGLAECGTHAITKVAIGPCTTGETSLAPQVLSGLGPEMLVLADRGLAAVELWRQACSAARSCCGGSGPAGPGRRCRSTGCWPMAPGCRGWTLAATDAATPAARSPFGCSTTPSTTPGGPGTASATGWSPRSWTPRPPPRPNWPPSTISAGSLRAR